MTLRLDRTLIDEQKIQNLFDLIRDHYPLKEKVALHEPFIDSLDEESVANCIRSSFVSSVGPEVDKFEKEIAHFTGRERAVAVVNGTSALHLALRLAGVGIGDLVITQALSFIATANAISYCGAAPIFVDVALDSLGLCPDSLEQWLYANAELDVNGVAKLKGSEGRIKACVPVNIFGHPCQIEKICEICHRWNIEVVEDCAESLGSFKDNKHTGYRSRFAILSFNGNKIITTGGGGAVLCSQKDYFAIKHLATTAKINMQGHVEHDQIGYNYRLPNINCSLGISQIRKLKSIIEDKRRLAKKYIEFGSQNGFEFFQEPLTCKSNYWLNTLICKDTVEVSAIQELSLAKNIETRKAFKPINEFLPYKNSLTDSLVNTKNFTSRLLNFPSGPNLNNYTT